MTDNWKVFDLFHTLLIIFLWLLLFLSTGGYKLWRKLHNWRPDPKVVWKSQLVTRCDSNDLRHLGNSRSWISRISLSSVHVVEGCLSYRVLTSKHPQATGRKWSINVCQTDNNFSAGRTRLQTLVHVNAS